MSDNLFYCQYCAANTDHPTVKHWHHMDAGDISISNEALRKSVKIIEDPEIATFRADNARLLAELAEATETWTDEDGTVWSPPTAHAYAMACNGRNSRAERAEAERDAYAAQVAVLREALDGCAGYITSPLRMSSDEAEALRRSIICERAQEALRTPNPAAEAIVRVVDAAMEWHRRRFSAKTLCEASENAGLVDIESERLDDACEALRQGKENGNGNG